MDQKPILKYKYAPSHVTPTVHGVLVATTAEPPYVTVHLYNEYPDVPPESPYATGAGMPEDTRVGTIIREVQATLVLPLSTVRIMRRAFNEVLSDFAEDAEQAEGTEDES